MVTCYPVHELYKMQKTAIQKIADKSYITHTELLLKELKIMPLLDHITFSKIQFMQRFVQNFLPLSFNDTWIRHAVYETLARTKFNYVTGTSCKIYTQTWSVWTFFPYSVKQKFSMTFPDENIKKFQK